MSVLSRPSLLTDINNNIFTNATEDITGDILQQRLQNIAESDFNKTTDTADNITAGSTNKFWTNTILQNIQNGSYVTASASGTDAYTLSLTPAITAYTKGQLFLLTDVNANTITGATININGLGVKNVIDYKGTALTVGAFAGSVLIAYDGTSFRMIGGGGSGGGGSWGSITGTLSSQTDLQSALDAKEDESNKATDLTSPNNIKYPSTQAVVNGLGTKQDTLVSGVNIRPINGISILGSTNLVIDTLTNAQKATLKQTQLRIYI
jgi:hypothetical protein